MSQEVVNSAPQSKTIIVTGDLRKDNEVLSQASANIMALHAHHKEAETRIVLHCINTDAETVVVSAKDTNILVLHIAHYNKMTCTNLWMKARTSKQYKYIPVHTICECLLLEADGLESLISFHVLTGSASVSCIAGHSN